MDWKRFAKKNLIPFYSPVYNVKDLVTKVQDNGLVDGIKEKLREDYIEDMPIIGNIYDMGEKKGRHEGKKEGYVQASNEYEKKLLRQADEFLSQKNDLKMQVGELNKLLDEYEECIQELEAKCESLTREQLILLSKLRASQSKLNAFKLSQGSKEKNAEKVLDMIQVEFSKLAEEYQLTEKEGMAVCENLKSKLSASAFNDMSASSCRGNQAYEIIADMMEPMVEKRNAINSPSAAVEYDERGFIKHTARHRNGTRYDDEGFDKYGRDRNGNRRSVSTDEAMSTSSTGNEGSLMKSSEKCGNGNPRSASSAGVQYDERGFVKNTARHRNGTRYDNEGFDKYGRDRNGNLRTVSAGAASPESSMFDERGFIKNTARHRNGTKYDDEGYDKYGRDKDGYDRNGLDRDGRSRQSTSNM